MLRLILTLFVSFFVGALICAGVALAARAGWLPATVDRRFLNFLNIVVGAASFHGSILICLLVFLPAHRVSWGDAFGFSKPGAWAAAGWGLLTICFALPVVMLLQTLSAKLLAQFGIQPTQQSTVNVLQGMLPIGQFFVYGFVTILLAPFAEEMLFRGILYPAIKQGGFPRLALWGTALLFAATHVNLMAFIPLTFLALVLTALYEKTENLIAPIVTHVMFNAVNFYFIVAPAKWKPDWFTQ